MGVQLGVLENSFDQKLFGATLSDSFRVTETTFSLASIGKISSFRKLIKRV